MPHAPEAAVARPGLCDALADHVQRSQSLLAAYTQAMDALKLCGAMPAVQALEMEVNRELRRQLLAAKEEPAVAGALADLQAARAAAEGQDRLAIQDINRKKRNVQN